MIRELRFGDRVKVKARSIAVYGDAIQVMTTSPVVPRPKHHGFSIMLTSANKYAIQRFSSHGSPEQPGLNGGWPGLAVPDYSGKHNDNIHSPGLEPINVDEKHRGGHRRIRRIPYPVVCDGIVVGHARRQEGRYVPGDRGDNWGNEGYDPPVLIQIRSIKVLQVALEAADTARIVDVWHEDALYEGDE